MPRDDLYKTLGINNTADKKTIKKAYRDKAKKMHPDQGGSQEKFGAIKRAYDVLMDNERRAKYDATGDIDEKTPDNAHATAINIIAAAFGEVLNECANQGQSPLEMDMVDRVRQRIRKSISDATKNIRILRNVLEVDKKMKGRFKSEKENIFEGTLANRIMTVEINIKNMEAAITNSNAALELIKDATFKRDARPPQAQSMGNFMFNVGWG